MTANMAVIDSVFKSEKLGKDVQKTYLSIKALEPLITKDVEQVASSLGNHMEGLQYSVKAASSVEDRLAREAKKYQSQHPESEYDYKNGLLEQKDIICYTEVCPNDGIVQTTKDTIAKMEDMGYVLSGVRNYYVNPYPRTQYKGIHLNFISPYGQEIELRIQAQDNFEAKQEGGFMYKNVSSVSALKQERELCQNQTVQNHQSVPKDKDYWEIENMSMEDSDKKALQALRRKATDIDIDFDTKEVSNGTHTQLSVVYTVSLNNEEKIKGFEHTFSDGSAWAYWKLPNEEKATWVILDKKGGIISEKDAEDLEINLDYVLDMVRRQEEEHERWMEEHKAFVMEMEGEEIPVPVEEPQDEKKS